MVISTVLKKENKENIPGAWDAKHLEPLLPCFSPAGSCCLCRIHYSTCPSHWVVRRHGVEVAWYVGGHFVVVRSMFKWWFSRNKEIKSIKITNVVASRPAASTGLLYGDRSSSQSSLQWHLVTQQLESQLVTGLCDRPQLRPKPGPAKPNFRLLARLVILQSPSRLKPGQSRGFQAKPEPAHH